MTNTATAQTGNFPDFDFPFPQPTQDTDLLRQLDFVPGLKEMLLLRQVHALEHATVWVLSERTATQFHNSDNDTLGGLSTDQGFYLYGQVSLTDLRRAVPVALERLTRGEWNLALHPRCGTNLSVSMLLTAGLALGTHFILPRSPFEQMIGFGLAAVTATQLAPELGSLAQKYLTTAIPFNLKIEEITPASDLWGRASHFVGVRWKD
ncbi:MAG: DUF6391 domain-containing protein [Coleofasciculaceae cyanobacterium]